MNINVSIFKKKVSSDDQMNLEDPHYSSVGVFVLFLLQSIIPTEGL